MARASDGPASSADLGWRSKDPTFHVLEHPVRSLLRQPRSALEAGPSEADLGWRSKDLTGCLQNMKRWILERGRISCQRQSYTELSRHLHFHKRYNVVLSTRITLCTIAVDTKSFPAPVSNVSCSVNIPLDLCYANQDLPQMDQPLVQILVGVAKI